LAAGLTGAINSAGIIVTAGLAEIAAGSIAMGLGGYLAAKSDAEHYAKEREREKREVVEIPEEEMREVAQVFHSYGLTQKESAPIVEALREYRLCSLWRLRPPATIPASDPRSRPKCRAESHRAQTRRLDPFCQL